MEEPVAGLIVGSYLLLGYLSGWTRTGMHIHTQLQQKWGAVS